MNNSEMIDEMADRIEQLETCAALNAETIGYIAELRRTVAEQNARIEKLEAILREAAPWLALLTAARDV